MQCALYFTVCTVFYSHSQKLQPRLWNKLGRDYASLRWDETGPRKSEAKAFISLLVGADPNPNLCPTTRFSSSKASRQVPWALATIFSPRFFSDPVSKSNKNSSFL